MPSVLPAVHRLRGPVANSCQQMPNSQNIGSCNLSDLAIHNAHWPAHAQHPPALTMPEPRGVPAASGLWPPLLGWLPIAPPSAAMSSALRRAGEACARTGRGEDRAYGTLKRSAGQDVWHKKV